ncbi:serine/threonine-protein kinase [Gemmata sp.]|uniref:serine/threonine-protein kinase n=1 Tax=Gemmata sp. TaxID=1914242 RepID=UPI003F6FB6F8
MPPTDYLLDLLSSSRHLDAPGRDQVVRWAASRREDGDVVSALVQVGVFHAAAVRTLELMSKGFIASADPAALFAPGGLARLRAGDLPGLASTSSAAVRPAAPTAPVRDASASTAPRTRRGATELPSTGPTGGTARLATPPASKSWDMPDVGATLGKCLLTGVLGRGGRGTVFSALHTTLNVPVAVKVLQTDDGGDDGQHRELRNEAQLLARLNHPNVVRVLDFDCSGRPYAVLELVEGPSLAELIVQTGGLRTERALEVVTQAARGLAAAWELSIVHRDIKPANILLTRSGVVKVADLGLAMDFDRPEGAAGPIGTCAYMSPEQARGGDAVDFRSDIYSLGATLYHAVTGVMPFTARNSREMLLKHATAPLTPAHEAAPGQVDLDLSEVVTRMMAKDPAARYGSYGELLAELEGLARPGAAPSRAEVLPVPGLTTQRPSSLMSWLFRKTGG